MLLMVAMALMTGAATLAVLWPLARRNSEPVAEGRTDVAFYQDQLADIDRDLGRGLLTGAEAEAARAEAGRRLLRARSAPARSGPTTGEPALRRRRGASALALSAIPLISLAVYGAFGSPHMTAAGYAERTAAAGGANELALALSRIEARLRADPSDGRGWDVVAPVYLRVGRFADAVAAFDRARRLLGDTEPRLAGLGEALVARQDGVVGAEAVAAFGKAVALDPASARSRFYLALAAEQDGRTDEARAAFDRLAETAPADAPWLPAVRERLATLHGRPAEAAARPALATTPEIRAMVDGLDARLKVGGGNEAEWGRLVRSFVVLGERGEATARLDRARTVLAGEPGAGARLDALARELGLPDRHASR